MTDKPIDKVRLNTEQVMIMRVELALIGALAPIREDLKHLKPDLSETEQEMFFRAQERRLFNTGSEPWRVQLISKT